MAGRSSRVLVAVLASGALVACAQASGSPAEVPEYASTSAAAGQFVTPVTCPTPNPVADTNQVICTDAAMTTNVIPGYFLASGDTRKQTEVAQTFQVGRIGAPGRLRTKLSRLFDPPTGTAPKLVIEFRTLIGGAIDITDGTTTTFSFGYVPYDALPLGADISTEYTVNMTSGAGGVGYQMQPGTTYAMVFRVPASSVLSIGIGGHEDAAQYGNGTGYLRQARLVAANTFSTPPFVADKRDVNFALGLDDGCVTGKMLTCGIGECYNTTPQCGVDPKTGLGQVGQFNTCVPYAPVSEQCDLKDNDCDGRTDEIADNASDLAKAPSFPPLGTSTCGIGACQRTYDNCTAGVPLAACVVGAKAVESCNSLDDDCDGRTDEIDDAPGDVSSATTSPAYPPIGYNTCGVGQCQRKTPKCAGGLPQVCLPNNAAKAWEACDGLDNDCDGFVDNRDLVGNKLLQSSYSGAAATRGVQECIDAVQACSATVVSCTPPANMPFGATTWNASASCTPNAAAWTTTTSEALPQAETCNGLDENCDGVFDATGGTLTVVDSRCNGNNYGAGAQFMAGMNALQFTPAATITVNRLETFTGAAPNYTVNFGGAYNLPTNAVLSVWSNDGTGPKPLAQLAATAPFTVRPTPSWQGSALSAPITLTAGTTYWFVHSAAFQGLQRNVDTTACGAPAQSTSTDGGATWTNGAVSAGWNMKFRFLNSTASKMTQGCWPWLGRGAGSVATPPPGFPQAQANTGICRDGTQPCASTFRQGSAAWGACTGFVSPTTESCNSLDDDCNGSIDDGLGSSTCGVGRCLKQFGSCCPQSGVQPDGTRCTPGTMQNCPSGAGTLGQGTISGNGGTFGGTFQGNPDFQQPEVCNGVDDDCNGTIDKNLAGATLSQSCYTGPAGTLNVGICRAGTQSCNAAPATLTAGSPPAYPGTASWTTCTDIKPAAETCNNVDDNCDGAVDNPSTSICPLTANVTGTNCVAANCQITSCANGWFNTDGNYANGCETNDDTSVTSPSCPGTQTGLGTLALNGANNWTGLIPDTSKSDWFVFNVASSAGPEGNGRAGTVQVSLTTNPSNDFRVQILDSCSVNRAPCATALTTFQFNDTCAGASGAADCRAGRTYAFPSTLIVRVFRAATVAGTAAQYTLNVRYQ